MDTVDTGVFPAFSRLTLCISNWNLCCRVSIDFCQHKQCHKSCQSLVQLIFIGGFPSQRPVACSFGVFFGLRLNKRLSKQWIRRWFETPSRSLWRHSTGPVAWWHHGADLKVRNVLFFSSFPRWFEYIFTNLTTLIKISDEISRKIWRRL